MSGERDRSFAARDAAVAGRDEAVAHRDDLLRSEMQLHSAPGTLADTPTLDLDRNGETSDVSSLPPDLRSIIMVGEHGLEYSLVIEAENPGPYEQHSIANKNHYQENARLLNALLLGKGTLIDLGANIGTVCIPVAKTGSRVIAVEPLPRNAAKLRAAARVNRLGDMKVVEAAVTDTDGPVGFSGTDAWGQVTPAADAPQLAGLTLDTIVSQILSGEPGFLDPPIVMKIDVEGHELPALRGAAQLLREHRPIFIFESVDLASEPPGAAYATKEFVASIGYHMFSMFGLSGWRTIDGNFAAPTSDANFSKYDYVLSPYTLGEPQIGLVYDILAIPSDRLDILQGLMPVYQTRPLSYTEKTSWVLMELQSGIDFHRDHAAAIIPILEKEALLEDDPVSAAHELQKIKVQL